MNNAPDSEYRADARAAMHAAITGTFPAAISCAEGPKKDIAKFALEMADAMKAALLERIGS